MEQSSDGEWVIYMAMEQKKGVYKNMVVVTTTEEPTNLVIDTRVKMYGLCTGSYAVENDNGSTTEYPSFSLLFWE